MTQVETRSAFEAPAPAVGRGRRTWRAAKRWMVWVHCWLGVVTCLFCVMWFLSGLVMLYVPFPAWRDTERIAGLPPVAVSQVRITPDEAMTLSGASELPETFRLETFAGAPVYRIVAGDVRKTIAAVTGEPIAAVTPEQAAAHVASVYPAARPALAETLDYDQWTPTSRFDPHRPLYRFALNDEAGTTVYVSSKTGEIVQNATRRERAWNWVGAVPHWIYFAPIRRDQEVWRQVVMWLSGPLVIGALLGVWLGILRMRPSAPRKGHSVTPYRGWMKWHHLGGLVGGVFLATWIFSGWLSVNPFKWFPRSQLTQENRTAFAGWTAASRLDVTPQALQAAAGASDISFIWVGRRPLAVARSAAATKLIEPSDGRSAALADTELMAAAQRLYPTSRIVATERLTEDSLYWYSHHSRRPLPIIELRFDDPAATWLYLDPQTGSIAKMSDRSARTYRWLFDFLHQYDLPLLLRHQPARDILIWLLTLAGLVISLSGVVLGWRTLKRNLG